MNETITLTNVAGNSIEATLICYFENVINKKQYLYYTLNEINGTDSNSTVKIYCAKVRQNDSNLDTPIDESTWEQLKGHMAEALKATLNPDIKFLPISSLGDKTVVSEKVIAMPVSYNYVAKHYKFYLDNISSDESIIEPTPVEPTPIDIVTPVSDVNNEPKEIDATTEVTESTQETIPVMSEAAPQVNTSATPIDIQSIEEKYAKMIEDINKLKEQEIEAIKRYNATIELSSMHNEQHASYVQSEQTKETPDSIAEPVQVDAAPIEPIPVEPSSVTSQPQDIETNWFDMPVQ